MSGHRCRYHAGHRLDFGHRQVVVEPPDLPLYLLSQQRRVQIAANHKIHPPLPGRVRLRVGIIEGGLLGPAQSEVPDIAYDANYSHPAGRTLPRPHYSGAERAFIGEVLSDKAFVDKTDYKGV